MAKSISPYLKYDRTVTSVGWKQGFTQICYCFREECSSDRLTVHILMYKQKTTSCMLTVLPVSGCIDLPMYSVSMAMY